ncbi:DUF4349 domain-containing protein [Candidatus Poriferisodalis sp.]|uniref:DUF4349 domain-containing protein n=1 Tax=Candidatus Poriferisodalis sp. TaxID=3101277 RepID=UPI003B59FAEA
MTANTDHRFRRRRGAMWQFMLAALALTLLAAACNGGSDDSDATYTEDVPAEFPAAEMAEGDFDMADDDMAMEEMAMEEEMVEQSVSLTSGGVTQEESGSDSLAGAPPVVPADLGRDIIYTAWISVEAIDVSAAAAEATSIIESVGGFTFAQQTSTRGRAHTTLTFKVRPDQFANALQRLSGVGELLEQNVSAEDVTDIVVDLGSRIGTAEISVDRLREFLSRAEDAKGVAELERELSDRETNLERLRGQLRSLQDRVDLATITLNIDEAAAAVPSSALTIRAWLSTGDEDPCLGFTELVAPPEGDVKFCFELENKGETTLTDVRLSSDALRFAMGDLSVVEGTDIEHIEPGDRVVTTLTEPVSEGRIAGRVATRGLDVDVQLRAVPVTADGDDLAQLARTVGLHLYVEEDDSPPGFGDALSGGWDALVAVGNGVLLIIGALLPFLPVIAIALWVAWWWLRRRRARRTVASGTEHQG